MPTSRFFIATALWIWFLQPVWLQAQKADEKRPLALKMDDYFKTASGKRVADAILLDDVERIGDLINKGVDIDFVGEEGMTPLFWALAHRKRNSFRFLLESGADPNRAIDRGRGKGSVSVMQLVAVMDEPVYLEIALENGGSPNSPDAYGDRTILFESIMRAKPTNVRVLVNAGSEIDWKDSSGKTPLLIAASVNNYQLVHLLLDLGADPKIADKYGQDLFGFIDMFGGLGIPKESDQYNWYLKVLERLGLKADE